MFQCFIYHCNGYDGPPSGSNCSFCSARCGSVTTTDSKGHIVSLASAPQHLPQSQMPFQAYANYSMGPPGVSFCFTVELPTEIGVCSGVCFLFSCTNVNAMFTHGDSSIWVCTSVTPWSIHIAGISTSLWWSKAHTRNGLSGCSSTVSSRGRLLLHSCPPAIPTIWWSIQLERLGRESPNPTAFPSWWGGIFLSMFGSTWWHDQLWICGRHETWWFWCVVIGFQVDEFTCTWSAEHFAAQSHICPGFTGNVSSLTHISLEPGSEDYSILDQVVVNFKQGLSSILTDCWDTGIGCIIWGAWCQFSSPPDNFTLNCANRKTGIAVVAYATLGMEQLISNAKVVLVDAIASLQEFDRGW